MSSLKLTLVGVMLSTQHEFRPQLPLPVGVVAEPPAEFWVACGLVVVFIIGVVIPLLRS